MFISTPASRLYKDIVEILTISHHFLHSTHCKESSPIIYAYSKKSKVYSVVDIEIYGENTRLKYYIIRQRKSQLSCKKSIQETGSLDFSVQNLHCMEQKISLLRKTNYFHKLELLFCSFSARYGNITSIFMNIPTAAGIFLEAS